MAAVMNCFALGFVGGHLDLDLRFVWVSWLGLLAICGWDLLFEGERGEGV